MIDARLDNLEACLEALENGAELDELLAQHPDLRPMLEAAAQAQQLGKAPVPLSAQQRSRTRVLAHAAQLRENPASPGGFYARLSRLAVALFVAVLAFLASSSLLVIASARSLPGDQLYPVKRVVEELRLNLSSNPVTLEQIEGLYQERRIEEVQQLLGQQRREMVSFSGVLTERGELHWTVGGVRVIVPPETHIVGEISLGNTVEVEGVTEPEGWVRASEIHLQAFEITGVVETLSNSVWVVSGQAVPITPDTQIEANIQIGSQVRVIIKTNDDGSLSAAQIFFVSPPPTATPLPTLTATPQPTQTPYPTELQQTDEVEDETDGEQSTETVEATDDPEDESQNSADDEDKKDDGEREDQDSKDNGDNEGDGGD